MNQLSLIPSVSDEKFLAHFDLVVFTEGLRVPRFKFEYRRAKKLLENTST